MPVVMEAVGSLELLKKPPFSQLESYQCYKKLNRFFGHDDLLNGNRFCKFMLHDKE